MRANADMRGVNDNWNESVKVLRLEVDQDKARAGRDQPVHRPGATVMQRHHRGPVPRGDKLIDIVLRQPEDERAITDIANAYLPTASGRRSRSRRSPSRCSGSRA
jgi:multidrug efflux pump subunit AcrB